MPRRSKVAVLILAAAAVAVVLVFRSAGRWLVVQDPLEPACAVVVLAGHLPFRAMEAAPIYKEGGAAEVWLTKGAVYEEDLEVESWE